MISHNFYCITLVHCSRQELRAHTCHTKGQITQKYYCGITFVLGISSNFKWFTSFIIIYYSPFIAFWCVLPLVDSCSCAILTASVRYAKNSWKLTGFLLVNRSLAIDSWRTISRTGQHWKTLSPGVTRITNDEELNIWWIRNWFSWKTKTNARAYFFVNTLKKKSWKKYKILFSHAPTDFFLILLTQWTCRFFEESFRIWKVY